MASQDLVEIAAEAFGRLPPPVRRFLVAVQLAPCQLEFVSKLVEILAQRVEFDPGMNLPLQRLVHPLRQRQLALQPFRKLSRQCQFALQSVRDLPG